MLRKKTSIVFIGLLLVTQVGWASEPEADAQAFFRDLAQRFNAQDATGFMALCHPALEEPPRELLQHILEQEFARTDPLQVAWTIAQVVPQAQALAVHVDTEEWRGSDRNGARHKQELYILRQHENRWLLSGLYQPVAPDDLNQETRCYTSAKGKFSLTLPLGWAACQGSLALKGVSADSFLTLAPDLASKVMMGVVQLPMKLDPDPATVIKKVVGADIAAAKRFTRDLRVREEGPVTVAGKTGYRTLSELWPKEEALASRKRLQVYFMDDPLVYFFVCDAIGESYPQWQADFQAIIDSFSFTTDANTLSRKDTLAAELAQGTVNDQVYTSEKFNCFIAAPDGWDLETSSNPAHLVQMQYRPGKSIVRLIAAQGIPKTVTLAQAVGTRIEGLRAVVKDFTEVSRREFTLLNTPAIESIQTFVLENVGDFHTKEVTLIHKGTYYLILCQCISPDTYEDLESDFDKIIESFGFMQ